jgi:chaperonin GroES
VNCDIERSTWAMGRRVVNTETPVVGSAKAENIPIDIKVGDRVLFGKWSGTEVKIDGQDLLIMKESDIMGVIEEQAAKKKAA